MVIGAFQQYGLWKDIPQAQVYAYRSDSISQDLPDLGSNIYFLHGN